MLVTERNFGQVMRGLDRAPRIIADTETTGLYVWHGARMIGVSVATPGASREGCFYFPFRHKPGGNLNIAQRRRLLTLLAKKTLTFWNGKFDLHMLMADGMPEPKYAEDVMLLLHLVNENEWKTGGSYELKPAAEKYIDRYARRAQLRLTEILAERGLGKGDLQELRPEEVEEYASDDVFYTEKFRELLIPAAKDWEVYELWKEVNVYSLITRRFEERGIPIDQELTKEYIAECTVQEMKLQKRAARLSGWDINMGSHPQVRRWLELPSSATKYIDEIEAVGQLEDWQRQAVTVVQSWRQWNRARVAYYEPLLRAVDEDGIAHPNILLHGTISGRPSARGTPNWFAIPRQTGDDEQDVYKVKNLIVARPGYVLVNGDYAQAELRLGAHYSRDEFNIKCFNEGKSPHKLLHRDLNDLGVEIDYDNTKRVSFGVMYGTGAPTLSKELKKDVRFARRVLKAAHALHPNYRPMLRQTEDLARELGYIRLWSGRVRRFNTLPDPQPWYHKACSNLIQGGIGEVMRVAITRLGGVLPQWDTHMLLQVYDSILFEVPRAALGEVLPIINTEMTRDYPFSVPMVAEIKVGKTWGNMKEVKVT